MKIKTNKERLKNFKHLKTQNDFNNVTNYLETLFNDGIDCDDWDCVYGNAKTIAFLKDGWKNAQNDNFQFWICEYNYGYYILYNPERDELMCFEVEDY